MKTTLQNILLAFGLAALGGATVHAQGNGNHNAVVGVFTVTPLPEALLTDQAGLIESGAGFLFEDGTAVGCVQFLESPQALIPSDEIGGFLSQDGVLFLDTPFTFEFTTWELEANGTVRIRGLLYGGLFDLPEGFDGASLGGFIFSIDPVQRDLIPFGGGDTVPDHVEFIQPQPSAELVADVAEFLVGKGILSQGRASKIVNTMIDLPASDASIHRR